MKIAIYVNYANNNFNKDFKVSNELLGRGHNVFLAVSDEQLLYFKGNCDIVCLGYSMAEFGDKYKLDIIDDIVDNV